MDQISHFEELDELGSITAAELDEWKSCQYSLHQLYRDEETYWQQRSRVKWFLEGDLNTKFFHVTASAKKKRNTIFSLEIEGQLCFDPIILRAHVTSFYKDLLGTTTVRDITLNQDLWSSSEKLTVSQCISLEAPFTLEEIKSTLFACNPNKSPGPDGLSFLFYQTFWETVKDDLFCL